jgi:nitronate monooxygenase
MAVACPLQLNTRVPAAASYPVQRTLTARMKQAGAAAGDAQRMQVWAGQSAALAAAVPAADHLTQIWVEAERLLGGA